MREGKEFEEIEGEKAEQRMKSTLKQNQNNTATVERREREKGTTNEKVAERIGIGSASTYRRACKVWDYAQGYDEHENVPPQLAEWMVDSMDSIQCRNSWDILYCIVEFDPKHVAKGGASATSICLSDCVVWVRKYITVV